MADRFVTQADFFAQVPNDRRIGEYALPAGDLSHCKSCGADIVWTRTAKGRAVPLSLATVQTRNGVHFVLSHFVDCPQRDEWKAKP